MRASDIMSRNVLTIDENKPLREARQIMVEEDITALPVTSSDGDLVGIITQTDFFQLDGLLASKIIREHWMVDDLLVKDLMVKNTVTLPETANLSELSRIMVDNHIHRVVIVKDTQITGLITAMDVLKAVVLSVS
ncbi:MAG: CBS domain-containing protein [Candidatus Cloacimonetes bacterium]|nr:CBS domain-containing protein [Candidatus Cloacimonadota bacterium]